MWRTENHHGQHHIDNVEVTAKLQDCGLKHGSQDSHCPETPGSGYSCAPYQPSDTAMNLENIGLDSSRIFWPLESGDKPSEFESGNL